jgi:hypothetical protein
VWQPVPGPLVCMRPINWAMMTHTSLHGVNSLWLNMWEAHSAWSEPQHTPHTQLWGVLLLYLVLNLLACLLACWNAWSLLLPVLWNCLLSPAGVCGSTCAILLQCMLYVFVWVPACWLAAWPAVVPPCLRPCCPVGLSALHL